MNETKKLIIALPGEMACGKGTVADYLRRQYKAVYYRFSDPGRDILKRLYKPASRENMSAVNSALRTVFGEDYLVAVLMEDVRQDKNALVVLDGARKLGEIAEFRRVEGFKLIYVDAADKLRYERLKQRAENSGDKLKTFEQFLQDQELETEKDIRKLKETADIVLDNQGTLEELYQKIDEMLAVFKNA